MTRRLGTLALALLPRVPESAPLELTGVRPRWDRSATGRISQTQQGTAASRLGGSILLRLSGSGDAAARTFLGLGTGRGARGEAVESGPACRELEEDSGGAWRWERRVRYVRVVCCEGQDRNLISYSAPAGVQELLRHLARDQRRRGRREGLSRRGRPALRCVFLLRQGQATFGSTSLVKCSVPSSGRRKGTGRRERILPRPSPRSRLAEFQGGRLAS